MKILYRLTLPIFAAGLLPMDSFGQNILNDSLRITPTPQQITSAADSLADAQSGGGLVVSHSWGVYYDTNPFGTSLEQADWHFDGSIGIAYPLPTIGEVELGLLAGVTSSRHNEFSALDSDSNSVRIAAGYDIWNLSYGASWYWSPFFDENSLTAQSFVLRTDPFPVASIAGFEVGVTPTVVRAFTDPSDYDNWSFGLNLGANLGLDGMFDLFSIGAGINYKTYDDYFGADRKGWVASASATLEKNLSDSLKLSVGANYAYSTNKLDRFDYNQFFVGPVLSGTFSDFGAFFGSGGGEDAGEAVSPSK